MITQFPEIFLADVWPEVGARLAGQLRRRVDPATAEDIVQETALRAVREGVSFASADDLLRWASKVGLRLAVDSKRRRRFIDPDPLPEQVGPQNVGATVDQRITLDAVAAAMRTLPEVDRAAILGPATGAVPQTRRESVKQNVARHRARVRLRTLLEGLIVALGWLVRRCRTSLPAQAVLAAAVIGPGLWLVTGGGLTPSHPAGGVHVAGWSARVARVSRYAVPGASDQEASGRSVAPPTPPAPRASGRSTPLAGHPVPAAAVTTTPPGGEPLRVNSRPRRPDDHLACVSALGAVHQCLDPPPVIAAPG